MTPWTSKKWLGLVFVGLLLALSALIVKPANYGALSLALAAIYATFAGTNLAAGLKATTPAKPDQPDAEGS